MKYECHPYDPDRYAALLRKDSHTNNLIWDNSRGQDVIIVQTAFGESAEAILEKLCDALNSKSEPLGDYTEVMDGVWVRYVSAADKSKNRGCRLNGEASTYTVFCCQKDVDSFKIFRPKSNPAMSCSCDIPLDVHITIHRETRMEGLFKRRQVDTGFYSVTFQSELATGYVSGSLCCRVGGLEIPVTKEMVEQGVVYIKTERAPELLSKIKGLRIVSEFV